MKEPIKIYSFSVSFFAFVVGDIIVKQAVCKNQPNPVYVVTKICSSHSFEVRELYWYEQISYNLNRLWWEVKNNEMVAKATFKIWDLLL